MSGGVVARWPLRFMVIFTLVWGIHLRTEDPDLSSQLDIEALKRSEWFSNVIRQIKEDQRQIHTHSNGTLVANNDMGVRGFFTKDSRDIVLRGPRLKMPVVQSGDGHTGSRASARRATSRMWSLSHQPRMAKR